VKQVSYDEGKELVATHICGVCGSPLTLPWGGSYNINSYVIRCAKDKDHEGFVKPKSYYRAWKDGEAVPLVIAAHFEKQRRKQLENQVGTEATTALEQYVGTTALTQKQATVILQTIWPDAPGNEVLKAAILCHQYQLNPLMKHVFLLPFNNRAGGKNWAMVLGIGATRLIASRRRPYSYDDGPRVMSEEEQRLTFGHVDSKNICAITILDDGEGHRAPGYGRWPRDSEPYGTEKGNTKENMAFIRSERNAFNRLLPGEMPQGIEVMEEQYVDGASYRTVAPGGELPVGETNQAEESVHPWLISCPEHGIPWIVKQHPQYGELRSHSTEDGWCKASTVFGAKFSEARDMLGWDKPKGDAWLKQEFQGTWSKITDDQRIQALDKINAMLIEGTAKEGELVAPELPF